jgi:hypothetical protein
MTLGCGECDQDMGPSDALPGREGTLVHPIVQSLVYLPNVAQGVSYELTYMQSYANRSLCFSCIEKALPEDRLHMLSVVYESFLAEAAMYDAKERIPEGLVSFADPLVVKEHELYTLFKLKKAQIASECIFCGENPRGKGEPYFSAQVIDRNKSSKNLTPWGNSLNYSLCSVDTGSVSFNICYADFMKHFPDNFRQLSFDMRGKRDPEQQPKGSEIYIAPEIEAEMQKNGMTLDKLVEDWQAKGLNNFTIITSSQKKP